MANDELVRVENLAFKGRGVARLTGGKTVFIESAVPGDLLTLELTKDHGRYFDARIKSIVEASPDRQKPLCPHFEHCGACPMQHIRGDVLRKHKRAFVVDALKRIGGINNSDLIVSDTRHAGLDWHYRNKIELQVQVLSDKLHLGFAASKSHNVIPVDSCLLLPKAFLKLPAKLAGALNYIFKGNLESLKRVSVRVSQDCKDVELALWTEPGACNRAFIAKVLKDTINASSLVRVLVKGNIEKRDVRNVEVLGGKGFWQERLLDFDFKVSAPSFFQTNSKVAELMIEDVLKWVNTQVNTDKSANKQIYDLYSGVGTFTLPLADVFDDVCAIEMAGSSIKDLRRNLEDNQLYADVVGGSVEYMTEETKDMPHVIVDPPRAGLSDKARETIIFGAPKSIAYVSCDPSTLARDMKIFIAAGYNLEKVTPFDMFPQTYHVESIAYLTKLVS